MKSSLSLKKPKLSKILVCTLLIAFVFQITAISLVQATSESIPRELPARPVTDDAVVSSDDTEIISTDDLVLISTEDKEINSTDESRPIQPSPDDMVVVSRDDPAVVVTEDQVIIPEGGEIVAPENSTTIIDRETEKTIPEDDTTIGVDTENSEEDYQPLISPQPVDSNMNAILGVFASVAVIAVVAVVLFVRRFKKIDD